MIIVAMKSGHDGTVAVLDGHRLLFSFETEKDSYPRHYFLAPETIATAADAIGQLPDVVAVGGWHRGRRQDGSTGAGYFGTENRGAAHQTFFGKAITYFSSSHERSHIMMAIGMAPPPTADQQAVLVWEGDIGAFYIADGTGSRLSKFDVMNQPGARYSLLYAIADPTFPEAGTFPRLEDAGKLMALVGYGRTIGSLSPDSVSLVNAILSIGDCYLTPKRSFRQHPLYNAGTDNPKVMAAAAYLTDAIFSIFAEYATRHLPPGLDLRISGGCGLNCEWNRRWLEHGHFRSVFVPPCTDDSGSAIGTAIDALSYVSGTPWIDWSCYSGRDFLADVQTLPSGWTLSSFSTGRVIRRLHEGRPIAWVQGRSEIGPRALGNRSILAEPFHSKTRDTLNRIKKRESFRPIAPCCAIEDVTLISPDGFEDPHMLYFRRITDPRLNAVTHIDGTARVQTVTEHSNPRLHQLLIAFRGMTGVAALCNTSLNRHGCGFINRLSDLLSFCELSGIDDAVVGDDWYRFSR